MRAAALLAVCLVLAPGARAAPPPDDGRRLVFLLEYVGTDYANAVRDGAVVNDAEYGEALRLTKEVVRRFAAAGDRPRAVAAGLQDVLRLIERRAPPDDVWSATRRVLPALAQAMGDAVARPESVPNLGAGRRLWVADCAPCHGETGAGDGPAAPDMQPPPTAFRGDFMERVAPRQIYHAVSFGVDGTAMPSFALAYTDRQRWDVAFYALTLRIGFHPARPPATMRASLDALATSSNTELASRLRATPGEVDHLRAYPPSAASAEGGVGVALQLQETFAGVAERVFQRVVGVTGLVRDPTWTAEKLHAERGDAWIAANRDELRYPGFRPLRVGSGFVVDDAGYVLSRDRLVRDEHGELAPLVDVELADQTHVPAAIVGAEPTLDLAVLRLPETPRIDAPALDFADSDRVQIGQWLIALGDPPGPERVFSVGVVSAAPERQCYQEALSATLLQSSLVVSDGGLGGPIVDIEGRVVGIAVQRASRATPATQILPMNLVLNLFEALKVARSNRSPWLGVSVLELAAVRSAVGAPRAGVYIDDVFDPSPASRAGVRPGDFLVALGGHDVASVGDFQRWLYILGIDTDVDLGLVRAGQPVRAIARIEVRPEAATTR